MMYCAEAMTMAKEGEQKLKLTQKNIKKNSGTI